MNNELNNNLAALRAECENLQTELNEYIQSLQDDGQSWLTDYLNCGLSYQIQKEINWVKSEIILVEEALAGSDDVVYRPTGGYNTADYQ